MTNLEEEINNLIKEIETKLQGSLSWTQTRDYPSEIKGKLGKIITEHQKGVGKIDQEAGNLQKENTNLKIQLNDSLQKIEEAQAESEQAQKLRSELEKKNEFLQAEKKQLELSLQQAQDQTKTSEKLQSELVEKQKAASELQEKLTAAQNEAEELKREITALEKQIVNDPEKKILKEQLASKQKQLTDAEANVKTLEEKRDSLNKEVRRLQTALINKNKEENPKIAELQKKLTDLQSQLATEQAELGRVRKEVQTAEEAKAQAEKERDARPAIKKEDFAADYQNRPTKSEFDRAVEIEQKEKQKIKEQLVTKDKDVAEKNTTISSLENELKLEKENFRKLENDKTQLEKERDGQKQEFAKQAADLTDEITLLKKQIVQQEETIKQFPTKVADYEELISQLKKENFELKNSKNEELEAVQKQLTDLLIENNPLRVIDVEEAKAIMTEYLEFVQKEGKSWKELATMATKIREKIEYEEKQKKWEARVEQVREIILKLTTSANQQLTTQIEVKK